MTTHDHADLVQRLISDVLRLEGQVRHLRSLVASKACDRCEEGRRVLAVKVAEQRRTIAAQDEQAHRRNLELDALHYVWCDGGCPSGAHRFGEHPPLTEEIVAEAEWNARRLRRWFLKSEGRKKNEQETGGAGEKSEGRG